MTHDERISSYIDNELTSDQEQEFLISLAASDGLRKSFRSELVLKKVLHHDEAAMNPPRKLRSAVFATLGIAGITATTGKASAMQSSTGQSSTGQTFVRSLFATKMSGLLTVAGISLSALAGYGVHSIVVPSPSVPPAVVRIVNSPPATLPTAPAVSNQTSTTNGVPAATIPPAYHSSHSHPLARPITQTTPVPKETVHGTSGSGAVTLEPPTINGKE